MHLSLFSLQVPIDYVHIQTAEKSVSHHVRGQLIVSSFSALSLEIMSMCVTLRVLYFHLTESQLTSEDCYQIATMGVPGLCIEIVNDAPPPLDEPPWVIQGQENSIILNTTAFASYPVSTGQALRTYLISLILFVNNSHRLRRAIRLSWTCQPQSA